MLEIVTYDDARLREVCEPVSEFNPKLLATIEEMNEAMTEGDGIGLAGPQVGIRQRLFVVRAKDDKNMTFINPEIIETSPEVISYEEGCLSLPGIYADVLRPEKIRVQAYNAQGKVFRLDAEGVLARVIQHELDHLNGVLFIDHISEKKRDKLLKSYFKKKKKA